MPTFIEAVRAKYKYVQSEAGETGELVGSEKAGRLQALELLTRVFVPNAGVDTAGPDGEVAQLCGAIEQLDLEGNPLDSWPAVLAITQQLPKLR